MKKKPEQYTRQGKTNNNIKSFLSNLKENDLHFEDNQITQCVFLGVLRLKPVPSVFNSNNLPSAVVENKTKKHKNNNSTKEVNKNISAKRDINKVISGKIRKKNPDTIKASVKKLATKKPVIKIKFNMNKNKKESSKDTVTIMQDSLTKITPQTMLQNKTITLNPIQTTPSFNPVQNLFDKLKQQMDEKYNRPGSSDVSKEILFSSEMSTDIQKGSKKSKKPTKKKEVFERLVMPLLPSNMCFTDNGYHSSTSTVSTKTSDDIIVINEENGDSDDDDDDDEVLVNTGPMPNFVLRTTSTEKIDNDVIIINDRSTPTMDHLVIDDTRSTRTSPRLNKNDQTLQKNTINQEQTSHSNVIINESKNFSETVIYSSKKSSEKPRKRRTLLPSIPLNFFNTSMLLRSELAQKKGGGTAEVRSSSRTSTSKVQKSENKQEKSLLKQRKDKSESKVRNSTENLIYEVVKSSTAVPDHSTIEKNASDQKNDVILIDNSPPKVEPLIIKLKVSQNKNSNEKSTQENGHHIIKNRSQKSEVAKITKNLFFPRLLRSDVTQQKPIKEKEDINLKKSINTPEIVPQSSTPSSRKPPVKLNISEEIVAVELPKTDVQNVAEKKAIVLKSPLKEKPAEKILSPNKKTEKSPESQCRQLRSDVTTDDGQGKDETTPISKIEDISKVSIEKSDVENPVIRKPRAQKKTATQETILIEKPATNQEKSSPDQQKSSPNQEKASPNQEKSSPNQEKSSPNQEKSSPNQEKSSPNQEKSSPNKEKPTNENLIDDQALLRQLRSNATQKNSNEKVIIVDQIPVVSETQKHDTIDVKKSTGDIGVISVAQFYSPNAKPVIKQTKSDVSQKKSPLDKAKDDSNNNQPKKDVSNKKKVAVRRPLRSDQAQKEAVDSEMGKIDKPAEKSKKELPKVKSVEESKCDNIQTKSNNTEDKNSKMIEEPKKILSKSKNIEVVRKLRSELIQKEVINKDDKILKLCEPDVKIVNMETDAQETYKTDVISKTKKVSSTLANLGIDLVDYANLSVDTTTPRRLRSEFAQKNDGADEVVDTQEKPSEPPKTKSEPEQQSTELIQNSLSEIIKVPKRSRSVSKAQTEKTVEKSTELIQNSSSEIIKVPKRSRSASKGKTEKTVEKIKRNRSLSKTRIEKPIEVENVIVDTGDEATKVKILNKAEANLIKDIKMDKKGSKQITASSKVNSNEKSKRKYTKKVKNPFSNKGVTTTEVLEKRKDVQVGNLSTVVLKDSKKSTDTPIIKKLKGNRSVSKARTKSGDENKNKVKPVEKVAKKKEKVTFKIKTVKKVFKQPKKLPPKAKINKSTQKNVDNNKNVFEIEFEPKENEVKVKVEKSDDEVDQKIVKTKVTKPKSADKNVQEVATKKTGPKLISKTNKIVKKIDKKQNKITLLRKISKMSAKVQPEIITPRKRGRKKKNPENIDEISQSVAGQKVAVTKETSRQPKIKPIQKKQDLDEISVVPEKRAKKHKDGPIRTLRSSFVPIVIKQEPPEEKPAAVVEKVVALIHSEPKPKILEEPIETKPVIVEKKEKIKPRILRSQNFNEIETINEIKEMVPPKEANKKITKKDAKKKGVSPKSKVITKNKKEVVIKTLRSDVKIKKEKSKASRKEIATSKKNIKTKGRSKIDQLTKHSKKKIIQQVKSKLKTTKLGNPLKKSESKKKPAAKDKMMLNWRNDDIIERIIQELRNTIFNNNGIENKIAKNNQNTSKKNLALKKSKKIPKKTNSKSLTKNKRKLLLAKKKLLQKKAALQRKLRSARTTETEANTSGSSESKENNPPKSSTSSTDDASQTNNDNIKEETTVHLVNSYLEEIKDNDAEKKTKSINIINDVTVQSNGNILEKPAKRKNEDTPEPTVSKRRHYKSIISKINTPTSSTKPLQQNTIDLISNLSKKNDITVFDFDESEPELPPLRHKTTPKGKTDESTRILKSSETQTTPVKRSERTATPTQSQISTVGLKSSQTETDLDKKVSEASAQTDDENIVIENDKTRIKNERIVISEPSTSFQVDKDKILVTDDTLLNKNPSKKKAQILVPAYDEELKPRKLWSVIKSRQPVEPSSPIQCVNISNLKPSSTSKNVPGSPESSEKKSPLKQATIIEMFSKVWKKRDTVKHDLFSAPKPSPQQAPKVEPPKNSPIFTNSDSKFAPGPRKDRPEDDDSDTESRIEWIPEEYAEYKLKYSVQKMMQYKPLYKCKICQVMMPTYYKLLKHRKVHDNQERPHVCPQCGSEFKQVEDFSAHLRAHKGKHPYMCHKCDLGFWTKKAFEAHAPVHVLRKVAQAVKKFRCDVCTKEFSKLCDVERHTRIHTGEKPCVCNICNKSFVQSHNLSKHLLTHLHIKPFICEICNKQFGRNDVLRRHLLTHSVQKPVKCSVCDRGFIRQSQLLQHMNKKHPGHSLEGLAEMSDDEDIIKNEDEEGTTSRVKS